MKGKDVKVGETYLAKVSGKLQRVKIERTWVEKVVVCGVPVGSRTGMRWKAMNLRTGRTILIKSAQRLRPGILTDAEHREVRRRQLVPENGSALTYDDALEREAIRQRYKS